MIVFAVVVLGLIAVTIIIQLLTKMRIVGGNELGIVSGKGSKKGFRSLSGGRAFVIPLLNKFAKLNLTPHTIEVGVDSAIAAGVVPLNVKATVSFAIASNETGRMRAVTRILSLAEDVDRLRQVASDIIEGHLRDSIASITPEQVMKDKDTLVAKMINVCKTDLENIGLEITTMNIADVDDHRLEGVTEKDLYIALLKRVQTASAETRARQARAEALAASVEQQEARRAEVQVRARENELENLKAETRVKVQTENQRKTIGVEQATRDAEAKVAGIKRQIEAEKQGIEMLGRKFDAEITTPAHAENERLILASRAQAARMHGRAQAEIDQLKKTLSLVGGSADAGQDAYIIENFERLIAPFAETLQLFPVANTSVITGVGGHHEPISAIDPNAIEKGKNDMIGGVLAEALGIRGPGRPRRPAGRGSEAAGRPSASPQGDSTDDDEEELRERSSVDEDSSESGQKKN
ncbi:SPFH domain-containing protein [Salinispira pacifica]